jgi:hypothetical protein
MSYIQIPSPKNLSIRNAVSLLAISSIMIMGGCNSKTGDTASVGDAKAIISSADYGDIGDVLKMAPRKVEAADSDAALKAVGLWEASERLSWDERKGEAGYYSFKNVQITAKDGKNITAKTVNFGGLHLDGETPKADVIDFGGLSINHDDTSLEIEHLGLTKLSLSQNLGAISDIDDLLDVARLDLKTNTGPQGPESVVFKGISGTADKTLFDVDTLGWGQDPKDQHLRFAAKDIVIKTDDKTPMTIRLSAAKLRGLEPINPAAEKALGQVQSRNGFLNLLTQNSQIGNISVKDFGIESQIFTLDLPSLEQSAKTKNGVTVMNADMPKLALNFTAADNLPAQGQQAMQIIKSLGFNEMIFSAKSITEMNEATDRVNVKAASFDLKEGFDLNYKGEFSGFGALRKLTPDSSPADLQAAQDNFKIHDFALSLEDKSIVERGFKLAGEMMGQTPKSLRRQANGMLAIGSLAALTQEDGSIYSEFTQALGTFLQDGGTMTIQLAPDEPITLKELDGLQRGKKPDLKRLGFSAATEP